MAASNGQAVFMWAAKYWEDAYSKTSHYDAFEWYLPIEAYTELIEKLVKTNEKGTGARLLNLGCGTSKLPSALYNAGIKQTTSIDFSAACIAKDGGGAPTAKGVEVASGRRVGAQRARRRVRPRVRQGDVGHFADIQRHRSAREKRVAHVCRG